MTAWNKRGAYCDWVHVAFPDGFAFPAGTNLLTGVTVMAYGELRSQVEVEGGRRMGNALVSLPQSVSIEPDASSFSHGLTPSNTYIFAWQNVCVERAATNRVDASIELFRDGSIAVRTASDVQPPTFDLQPPIPPEGFVGHGQDTNWLANAFSPTDYAAITNKGYETWLMEDCVGINVQNGLYKISVSIADLPVGETYADEVEFFDGHYHPNEDPPSPDDNTSSTNSTGNASSTNSIGSASNP